MSIKIGLALGGGAARGLAHITLLEAFDELGITPSIIAGCSMGALVGACYAGGMSGKELREHALRLLSNRLDMLKHVFGAKKLKPQQLLSLQGFTAIQMEGRVLADIALPDSLPKNLEDCPIPFRVVTTNYTTMSEHVLDSGSMIDAVGASIAIPGLVSGPTLNGHVFVDGGVCNPVPFDLVRDNVDICVAIDVTGRPKLRESGHPSNIEIAIGSLLIMFHQQAELRRALNPPDIYISPAVDQFGSGDFFRAKDILVAAESAKDELKRQLEKHIASAR
jgi:NTE family protein